MCSIFQIEFVIVCNVLLHLSNTITDIFSYPIFRVKFVFKRKEKKSFFFVYKNILTNISINKKKIILKPLVCFLYV